MIKKAQIRFILITMSILFCVFAIIFGVSYTITRNVNDRGIEKTLDDVREAFNTSSEVTSPTAFVAIIPFGSDNDFKAQIYTSEKTFLTEKNINNVIKSAINKSYNSGSVEHIYYILSLEYNNYVLVGADVSTTIQSFSKDVLRTISILAFIYLLLLIIVVFASFSVFAPIKEAFYKQKQFISNASHELKTPLAIISANADVLKRNEKNQWVENINSQTERMGFLINDLLTLATIDEEKVKIMPVNFNLSEVITNDALPFDAVAFEKNKTLNLYIQPNIQYKGDLNSVKNIVNILLDNAIKHANDGGEINVYLKKENGKILFTVYNTGSNVSEHEAHKVFERFYRGESSRSRESGGSGLGLSIAKSIADNNKWKISAISKLNQFMSITVIF